MNPTESALVRDAAARVRLTEHRAYQRINAERRNAEHWQRRAIAHALIVDALLDRLIQLRDRNRWLEDELLRIGRRT